MIGPGRCTQPAHAATPNMRVSLLRCGAAQQEVLIVREAIQAASGRAGLSFEQVDVNKPARSTHIMRIVLLLDVAQQVGRAAGRGRDYSRV